MDEKEGKGRFQRIKTLAVTASGIINIAGISESRSAAIAGLIVGARGGQTIIITPTYGRAERLAEDLSFFVKKKIILLPDEECSHLAYDAKSHHIMLERLSALSTLVKGEDCIIVVPVLSAVKKVAPRELFCMHRISLSVGGIADSGILKRQLTFMGYERTGSVEAKGQYSLRGDILDVFPPDLSYPCRIEFFDVEVDSIRLFDPFTQRSVDKIDKIEIYPAEQMIRTAYLFEQAANRIQTVYNNFSKKLTGEKRQKLSERLDRILECIETNTNIQYLENYIHYFYEKPEALWEYLNPEYPIIIDDPDRVMETLELAEKEYRENFKLLMERGEAVSDDYDSFAGPKSYLEIYDNRSVFAFTPFPKQIRGVGHLDAIIPVRSKQAAIFNGRMDFLETELLRYIKLNYKIIIVCSTEERVENIKHFLTRCKIEEKIEVRQGILSGGMEFSEEKLLILCDKDIFISVKHKRTRKETASGGRLKVFTDIHKGDYVVHENHGVGKFLGVVQLEVQGVKRDYLKIKYAGEDLLYIPVDQMNLVQKYVAAEGATPKINKLAGGEWKKTRDRAKSAINNMAKELIALSAARQLNKGYAFSTDNLWQREFEDLFRYVETPDQLRSIQEIKKDMEKPMPMDRLLCGDVGYGKTEVAARAVFKCVADGKQAGILVPTTLLANQHYYTFKERFEAFPFKVEMLSRFRNNKQQEIILEKVKRGEIDILIGTHRMLSSDVVFYNLGLLVIDEEQHFGVQHKERIKLLRKNVDVLTLSATPIPRTLHMSLVGIRDISLIEEPPEERYPVQTYVMEQDDDVIREAIERERDRGGQIYVVFNRIRGIYKIASQIQNLVPQASVVVAHGQMDEKRMEDIMLDFVNNRSDILVATTIIESGIDIPNVNTMIVLDADRLGLSQLYQLRGRVGRSNRMAYAYLMYQKDKVLSETAEKRLRAIREFTEFGAGFHIAMRDLEIRGAGNLLGSEQHGHMMMIGYELYYKLVEDAVRELSACDKVPGPAADVSVEIDVEAYIPNAFIQDELIKLQMYKKIASIRDQADRQEVIDELLDRFGEIPKETLNLIDIADIKAMAEKTGITRIRQEKNKLILDFDPVKGLDPERVSKLVDHYGLKLLIHGGQRPFIKLILQKKDILTETIVLLTKLT
ncbi:MAG: transcription-repair coupling factor [Eubacteriales bacterium]|nr:transcription-repair coupling factor [Eubacteriales bacterium]MDD4582914.1 transcription-repair coupling factor [Eubacteriales bacterium]